MAMSQDFRVVNGMKADILASVVDTTTTELPPCRVLLTKVELGANGRQGSLDLSSENSAACTGLSD